MLVSSKSFYLEAILLKILVINAGSSSLKYQLIDMDGEQLIAKGICERIGIDGRISGSTTDGRKFKYDVTLENHTAAFLEVKKALTSGDCKVIDDLSDISAVGHRIVQGGSLFKESVLVDEDVIAGIESLCDLAPLHNAAHIQGIRACREVFGEDVPEVVVFDNAFHSTMPPEAFLFPLPYEYYEKYKVRRYGFHGTSHKYVSQRAADMLGKPIEQLKLISCHLGNGSSVTAIDGGKSVDTSMGFTPLAGLPMGTRSGDIDAGILEYLMNKYGMDIKEMVNVLNKKSGVMGVSGVSSDFRDLEEAFEQGNERAGLAVDMFNYGVKKLIGAYAAAMGGVDAIIFTAGVGENSASQRMAIASGLEFMGVKMDEDANKVRGEERVISAPDSKVTVLLIPTNEELMIAMDTEALVG